MHIYRLYAGTEVVRVPLWDMSAADFSSDPIVAGDATVSIDGAAFANATNLPVNSGGIVTWTPTAAELTGKCIIFKLRDQSTPQLWTGQTRIIETYGHASAAHPTWGWLTGDAFSRLPAALVGGRMDAYVGAFANNVLTNAATDSTYVSELQNGLMTAAGYTAPNNAGIAQLLLDTLAIMNAMASGLNLSSAERLAVGQEVLHVLVGGRGNKVRDNLAGELEKTGIDGSTIESSVPLTRFASPVNAVEQVG